MVAEISAIRKHSSIGSKPTKGGRAKRAQPAQWDTDADLASCVTGMMERVQESLEAGETAGAQTCLQARPAGVSSKQKKAEEQLEH